MIILTHIIKKSEILPQRVKSPKSWKTFQNHSKEQLASLLSTLEAQTDTFILPSDKTNRFCTISESTCMEKVEEHLSFGWEQLPQDPTKGYEKEANNIMKTALAQADIRDSYLCGPSGRLATRFSNAPIIWPMGKDHKSNFPNCKLRMVQPISKSAVEKLDVITGKVLTQILPLLSFRVGAAKVSSEIASVIGLPKEISCTEDTSLHHSM